MSKPMMKGVHRRALGIGFQDQVMAPNGFETGGDGNPTVSFPAHNTVALFDDFQGDLIADEWAIVEGDTGYSAAIANVTNGVLRLSGSETVASPTAESNTALTQGLFKQWKADMGGRKGGRLRLSARVKMGVFSDTGGGRPQVFVGFSDSGGAEFPAFDTGAGVISNAADMVGFLYAPSSAANYWLPVAVKSTAGDSGDQSATVPTADRRTPVQNVYDTLELEVRNGPGDTGGAGHFWVNGKKVATINSPVGSSIALTPWIGLWEQDTGQANTLDIDYVAISAPRDTGE